MRKSKIDIINETVQYYSEDTNRRAVNDTNGCSYYFEGKMCAVGRCVTNPQKFDKDSNNSNTTSQIYSLVHQANFKLNARLKPEYRGHDLNFWEDLQSLHDTHYYWKRAKGLTEMGQSKVKELLERYKD
jgi:hypothetical protein